MFNKSESTQTLKPENYLELWKYFTDDAAKIKDRMWMIASLFFGGISTMISFSTHYSLQLKFNKILPGELMIIVVLSICVIGLCLYFKYVIRSYGLHIQSGWNRANYIRHQIGGLSEIWFTGNIKRMNEEIVTNKESEISNEAKRLIFFTSLILWSYLILLTVLLIFSINLQSYE